MFKISNLLEEKRFFLALINGFICTTCITVSNAINIFLKDILLHDFPSLPWDFFLSFDFYFILFHAKHTRRKEERKSIYFNPFY